VSEEAGKTRREMEMVKLCLNFQEIWIDEKPVLLNRLQTPS
jgi:hypothetical protein